MRIYLFGRLKIERLEVRRFSREIKLALLQRIMTKNQELYAWYKQMGICPQCGTNKAALNRVRCEECLAKNAESEDKHRKIKPITSRKTYNKNLREQRKENGLCIWCGKPICSTSTVYCIDCKIKNQRRNDKRKSGIERSERHEYGLCYICGKRAVEGKRLCADCYKRSCDNLPDSKGGVNYWNWKLGNNLIFGNGGRK